MARLDGLLIASGITSDGCTQIHEEPENVSRFNRSGLVVVGVLLLFFAASRDVEAEAFFRQFGTLAPVLAPGQGVSFVLGGTQRPGQVIPELSFHLRLFINRGATLLGNETLAPELIFSPGDVLRFRLGDAVVIYQYDDPTNILDPPFMHFGFVAPTDIDDNFAPDSPIGRALAQNDTNGTTLSLEVLAGDGVRFSGLEIADPVAGDVSAVWGIDAHAYLRVRPQRDGHRGFRVAHRSHTRHRPVRRSWNHVFRRHRV